jgi:hypothetical protein
MTQEWNKNDRVQPVPTSKEKGKWAAGPLRKPEARTKPRNEQVKCYGCGRLGHFSYDPICPNKTQLRAARVENSEELPNLEEVSDSKESTVDEEQYEPDTEGSDIPPHPRLEDIQESEHSGNEQIRRFQEYASDSDEEYLRAARVSNKEVTHEPIPAKGSTRKKNERPKGKHMCMVAWVEIGGTKALTLFDSGSTLDAVSLDFAQGTNLRTFHLDKPINLQLGCVGSRGSINFGTRANTGIGKLNLEVAGHYWDVINLDRYDAVVGVRFMREKRNRAGLCRGSNQERDAGAGADDHRSRTIDRQGRKRASFPGLTPGKAVLRDGQTTSTGETRSGDCGCGTSGG